MAAGLGTRLRPLTDDRPKALVEVCGRTLLEITLTRLRRVGIREVIVNVHHFADMVVDYLEAHEDFGMHVEISREESLLDTGGGLKKAAWFFLENSPEKPVTIPKPYHSEQSGIGRSLGNASQSRNLLLDSARPNQNSSNPEEPFLLHNVDVISTIDLERMLQFHCDQAALATLAVQNRPTSRYLLFDEQNQLCGRQTGRGQPPEMARPCLRSQPLAFSGVHVISPRFLRMMTEEGAFSIIKSYLRLTGQGERICAFRADEYYWRDLGKPEGITKAAEDVKRGIVRL